MRVLDRYIIRQALLPAFLGVLVFTFLLIIPLVLQIAEELVPKAVPTLTILRLVVTLLPQALALSIPMGLLLGLLIAFGRLSADREFVAMQACGISVTTLLRPVILVAALGYAATQYILLVAVQDANQAYREITFQILVDRAEGEVKPRVFFDKFPDLILYVREMPMTGGWKDVFMVSDRPGQPQAVFVAERGRVIIDRNRRVVDMILENAQRHVADAAGEYRVETVKEQIVSINPDTVFPGSGPGRGEREMSLAELHTHIAELERTHQPTESSWIEIYKRFSIPFACIVLGFIGLSLGVSNRRDRGLSSFVIGLAVILVYYLMLEGASNLAKGRFIQPWLAVWTPNLILGALGLWMFIRHMRGPTRPNRLIAWFQRAVAGPVAAVAGTMRQSWGNRVMAVRIPFMRLLDRYVTLLYFRILMLSFFGLIAVFYLSTFIDLSDEVLRGDATWRQLLSHLWYGTPQNIYYVLPMAVLLATLVTIGLLTKNSELIVMKACGMSLYRVAAPLVLMGLLSAAVLVFIQERILGPANYRAQAVRHVIRGGSPETFDVLSRRWIVGTNGDIYNYTFFNPRGGMLSGLSVYHFDKKTWRLTRRTYADRAVYTGSQDSGTWTGEQGWTRDFSKESDTAKWPLTPFDKMRLPLEPVRYFSTESPNADFMNYTQLDAYIENLRAGGHNVTGQRVALERKLAFPLVALIMTLIAVPFAVTTGARGAMYGIGAGLVLAFGYWGALTVFGALGSAGLFNPALAAWAPNLLFGTAATYLILTART
jgi:LPS export ABC transporter permease LptG/LPS export ABC transporter permease LptF